MSAEQPTTAAWSVCPKCGAVVADDVAHAVWHATLIQTTKRAS